MSAEGQAASTPGGPATDAHANHGSSPPPVAPSGQQRPEVLVGAAFVGGLATALLLRRLRGGR